MPKQNKNLPIQLRDEERTSKDRKTRAGAVNQQANPPLAAVVAHMGASMSPRCSTSNPAPSI